MEKIFHSSILTGERGVLGHDGLRFPTSESSRNGEGTGEAFWRFEIGVGGRIVGLAVTAGTGGTCCCCCCVALWLFEDSSKRRNIKKTFIDTVSLSMRI